MVELGRVTSRRRRGGQGAIAVEVDRLGYVAERNESVSLTRHRLFSHVTLRRMRFLAGAIQRGGKMSAELIAILSVGVALAGFRLRQESSGHHAGG